ncbi:hypothetical protein [Actinoplanes solisilvae]|uniref:hypothetical protein n=1 Tax=Actinoplanes solisilvae TaxID=2486853 RepID=UPI000FDB6810|nr:hypothetical protein [Actinoplanes solisilvae]
MADDRSTEKGDAEPGKTATTGVTLTVAATVLGIAGGFIQVQDEPAKVWTMGAAVLAALAASLAFLVWRKFQPHRRRRWQQIRGAAGSAVLSIAVFLTAVSVKPADTPASPAPTAPDPAADVYMHEIMSSSLENTTVRLGPGGWAMTEFRVTRPYLRSIEVAAGSNGEKILLIVYDENAQEIASGEPIISGYRAKHIFRQPKDISAYVGSRLYLMAANLPEREARVYFTKHDADPGINSYLRCPRPRPLDCLNPRKQDLNALVVGREAPW